VFQVGNGASLILGLRSKKLGKIVDAYRVDLIEELFAERGGKASLDMVSRIAIENYALVCAQHKTIEARLDQDGLFTQTGRRRSAFDMLKAISETIDRLRAQLPPVTKRSPPDEKPGLEGLSIDQLLERTTILREHLLTLRNGPAKSVDAPEASPIVVLPAQPSDPSPLEEPSPVEPPECCYCRQPFSACVDMKAAHISTWRSLHWNDPAEVQRRSVEATKEMMHQAGKPLPDWYR
jgi:hypothetical protein